MPARHALRAPAGGMVAPLRPPRAHRAGRHRPINAATRPTRRPNARPRPTRHNVAGARRWTLGRTHRPSGRPRPTAMGQRRRRRARGLTPGRRSRFAPTAATAGGDAVPIPSVVAVAANLGSVRGPPLPVKRALAPQRPAHRPDRARRLAARRDPARIHRPPCMGAAAGAQPASARQRGTIPCAWVRPPLLREGPAFRNNMAYGCPRRCGRWRGAGVHFVRPARWGAARGWPRHDAPRTRGDRRQAGAAWPRPPGAAAGPERRPSNRLGTVR